MFSRLGSFLRAVLQRNEFEGAMHEEMRFHIDAYAAELMREGMSPAAAARQARIEFGSAETAQEDCRRARGLQLIDEVRQDMRYAARQCLRSPGFTAAALLSLALGIGASTAIFSLMDAVMFRTLPIEDPPRLHFLAHRSGDDIGTTANYPLLERYQAAGIFTAVTSFSPATFNLSTAEGIERASGQYASGNYHEVVGVPIAFGRGFREEPDRPDGRAPIAVISYDFAQRNFGGGAEAIGRTLAIGTRTCTIVGVTAPGFHGLTSGSQVDITLPLSMLALSNPDFLNTRDGWTSLTIVGRRAEGTSEQQAMAAVAAVFRRFWLEPENEWAHVGMGADRTGLLTAAGRGTDHLRELYTKPLRVLMAMVGVLLLIACANVANLLLARSLARSQEIAIRTSIGAGRGRLIRQFLTESLLLAIAGGALGLLVAVASTGAILSTFNIGASPTLLDVSVSRNVLAFTLAVSALTGMVFGVVPAIKATRVDLAPVLKESAVAVRRWRRFSIGKPLVIAQISLSVLLIAAAGLLVRSVSKLRTFDLGFVRENVLLFNLDVSRAALPAEAQPAFYENLHDRLSQLPRVSEIAFSKRTPLDFSAELRGFRIPGVAIAPGEGVSPNVVSPDYFRLFGIGIVRGRGFTAHDRAGAQPVVIVNETLARAYFGVADPIGHTMQVGANGAPLTIIGVVRDGRHESLREQPPRMVFTPAAQPALGLDGRPVDLLRVTVALRTSADADALASLVRAEVRALTSGANVSYLRTMQQQVDATLIRERLLARLSLGFGTLALFLAFVGLYGVMSYNVARRAREIGIRMAVGASRSAVLRQVLSETLLTCAVGVMIGIGVTLVSTRFLSTFLFELSPRDPTTLAVVVGVLLMAALAAGYRPARRAAAVEPIEAIRGA